MAASTRLDASAVQRWREALLELSASAAGREALRPLADIKIRDFVRYDPGIETLTRNMMQYSPVP